MDKAIKGQVERLVSDVAHANKAYALLSLCRLEEQQGWVHDAIDHSVSAIEDCLQCTEKGLREPVLSEILDCLVGILHKCQRDGQLHVAEGHKDYYLRVLAKLEDPHAAVCTTFLLAAHESREYYPQPRQHGKRPAKTPDDNMDAQPTP